jgi:uncharacterized protein YpuA (DUF1002 family)
MKRGKAPGHGAGKKMKMKRILPLLMAAAMVTTSIPLMASASDTTGQDASVEETEGTSESGETSGIAEAAESIDESAEVVEPVTPEEIDETSLEDQETEDTESEDQVDTNLVVTLGENLTEEQRASMYEYFGTSPDKVRTIIVTHEDEVNYMDGIATAEQIGATTNSCAYVEPTESGGIKVKTANLNYVTSTMIASTLTTAGVENCNVIAACPFEVSGTGALTGIIMAYETASGESLDEGKKEAAMEELITTGNLADAIGSELATEVMNDVKTEILDKGLTDPEEIGEAVDKIAANYDVTLTDDQRQQIVDLMAKISQYDYDLDAIQKTLDNLNEKVGALQNVWNSIKSFFVGSDDGILSGTNDSVLGDNVLTDSTVSTSGFKDGLLTRILNLFKKDE